MKTKRDIKRKHYKTLDNVFLANLSKEIYSREYKIKMLGYSWYTSGYYPNRNQKCSFTYNDEMQIWELGVDKW